MENAFVWIPEWNPVRTLYTLGVLPLENSLGIRAYYYTSVVGDDPKITVCEAA